MLMKSYWGIRSLEEWKNAISKSISTSTYIKLYKHINFSSYKIKSKKILQNKVNYKHDECVKIYHLIVLDIGSAEVGIVRQIKWF